MTGRFCILAIATILVSIGAGDASAFQVNTLSPPGSQANPVTIQQTIPAPIQPEWYPLAPEMQQYINQLLAYWEQSSSSVTVYECDFQRWEMDAAVYNIHNIENKLFPHTISNGKIRYSAPGKGMYEVTQKWRVSGAPPAEGGDPPYQIAVDDTGTNETEKWICSGEAIFEFDAQNKRLYELQLPPESQGEALNNSPLPFVFGAKAQDMLNRFWIRDVTPPNVEDQYWLEIWPKHASDAQSYKKVEIILSRDPFLPKAIHVFAPNYDPKTRPAKMAFEFENRVINSLPAKFQDFLGNFVRPATPFGWKRVTKNLASESGQSVPATGQLPQNQSQR